MQCFIGHNTVWSWFEASLRLPINIHKNFDRFTHLLWRSLVHSVSKDLTHWYKLYRAMKEYILWPQQLDQRMSFQNISFIAFTLSYPEYTLSIDHEIVHCALCSSSAELTEFHLQHSRCAPFHSQTSWKPKYFRPPLAPMTKPIFDSVETSYNIYSIHRRCLPTWRTSDSIQRNRPATEASANVRVRSRRVQRDIKNLLHTHMIYCIGVKLYQIISQLGGGIQTISNLARHSTVAAKSYVVC